MNSHSPDWECHHTKTVPTMLMMETGGLELQTPGSHFSCAVSVCLSTDQSSSKKILIPTKPTYNFRMFRCDGLGTFRDPMLAVLKSRRNSGRLIFPSLSMSASSSNGSMEPLKPVCYKQKKNCNLIVITFLINCLET